LLDVALVATEHVPQLVRISRVHPGNLKRRVTVFKELVTDQCFGGSIFIESGSRSGSGSRLFGESTLDPGILMNQDPGFNGKKSKNFTFKEIFKDFFGSSIAIYLFLGVH
jgi:hypothetical protein